MNILRTVLNNTKNVLLVLTATIPLVACAEMNKKPGDDDPVSSGTTISDFKFSVSTNKDGSLRPVVTDRNGNQLTGQRLPRDTPIKTSLIEEIETITIIRAKGSHFLLVVIGGIPMRFDLAHP